MKKITMFFALFLMAQLSRGQTAEVQVIHNCADPAADSVDVYVNGLLAFNNFAFRNATGFTTLPAGVPIEIGIAPKNSSSVADTLVNYSLTLADGERYVAIATGVLDPSSFASNPDGRSTGFNLLIKAGIPSAAPSSSEVNVYVAHGSTDAPTVDVIQQSGGIPLVDNAALGDITDPLVVFAGSYTLNITPGSDNGVVVESYLADLTPLGGGTAVVFASGFLDPSANQSGEAFGLFAALSDGTVLELPTSLNARIQLIHNAADPAADLVDIYINGSIAFDDFAFRTATPFTDVPANTVLNVGIAPGSSTSVNDTLVNIPLTLENGQTYIGMANGVLDPSTFAANPDGRNTGFNVLLRSGIRIESTDFNNFDMLVFHGATDAPTVDVIPQSSATPLVDGAAFGDLTNYISVPAAEYILNVTPATDNTVIVGSYQANLNLLGGNGAVVFASGFLDPSANQSGEAFGLFVALPSGTVVELLPATSARLQVIHNCADPAADSVDIYVNGSIFLQDFHFREATAFTNVPAGQIINIAVAPGTSSSVADALTTIPVNLTPGGSYVAVASGVLDPSSFAPNPDAVSTGFSLSLRSAMREASASSSTTDLVVLHGSTDAPAVDVIARNVGTLVDNAAYTDFAGYLSVPNNSYILDITPANDNNTIVASFGADLTTLGGGSAVVFASGFLNPAANQNGAAFGLFAALTDGTVLQLPLATDARLQVIHNCADPAANSVDIYVNGAIYEDDFNFLEATEFRNVPSGVTLNIGIAPGTSTSVADTLVNIPVTLNAGEKYLAVASGVLNPASFAANPDGRNTGFQLLLQNQMREASSSSSTVDIRVIHGSTDAPGVDVIARGVGTIVDNALYTDITGYLSVPNISYILDITPQNDNSTIVASFGADITSLGGASIVVFAGGFLDPAANQTGSPFGLYAALTNGTVIPLNNITSIEEMGDLLNGFVYPNPASSSLNIPVKEAFNTVTVNISDLAGRLVSSQIFNGGSNVLQVNVNNLEQGTYTCTVIANGVAQTSRVMIAR